MALRQLDPNGLGLDEDWEGNNIAFACPACGEVYIVSHRIHPTGRKCPACGKSRGIVTEGGKKSGGKEKHYQHN